MWTSIILAIIPLAIKIISYVLDYIQAKDETKKQFYLFVAAWEKDRGVSVSLSESASTQLERVRQELAGKGP